ncbi:hypothetical protein KBC14_01660 [Candidatus Woesebacteria bacterium]|jgi:hypothetical protein|nr:hypothetical protein [Candidatus Woesebacteria bacterium]MBP6883078.1 hypothetical protein [Candidatus Woesebacteria bacterium]
MKDIKLVDSVIKTPGFIEQRMVKCGKANCKCTRGKLHGPYFYYRYWKLHHKVWIQKRKYVTQTQAEKLKRAIQNYKQTISLMEKNPYRAYRRSVTKNIKIGISGMTQRKLVSVSALMKSFV